MMALDLVYLFYFIFIAEIKCGLICREEILLPSGFWPLWTMVHTLKYCLHFFFKIIILLDHAVIVNHNSSQLTFLAGFGEGDAWKVITSSPASLLSNA